MTREPDPSLRAAGVPTCFRHPQRETYVRCQRCDRPICPDCMRDAAVGFQCPQCVAEAAKATRSGRTAYGGLRPANPTATSLALIVLNAGVWLAIQATGGDRSPLRFWLALHPRGSCWDSALTGLWPQVPEAACRGGAGVWVEGVASGAWWQLLTNAFTHVSPTHLVFNLLALWVLGPQLEVAVGRLRFLAVYLGSAVAASVFMMWFSQPYSSTLGASGAVFGLMGALLVVVLKVRANPSPILLWLAVNVVITVVGRGFISWQAHLGGFLGGLLVGALVVYAPRRRRTLWQAAGIGLVAAVMLVLIAVRAAMLG